MAPGWPCPGESGPLARVEAVGEEGRVPSPLAGGGSPGPVQALPPPRESRAVTGHSRHRGPPVFKHCLSLGKQQGSRRPWKMSDTVTLWKVGFGSQKSSINARCTGLKPLLIIPRPRRLFFRVVGQRGSRRIYPGAGLLGESWLSPYSRVIPATLLNLLFRRTCLRGRVRVT